MSLGLLLVLSFLKKTKQNKTTRGVCIWKDHIWTILLHFIFFKWFFSNICFSTNSNSGLQSTPSTMLSDFCHWKRERNLGQNVWVICIKMSEPSALEETPPKHEPICYRIHMDLAQPAYLHFFFSCRLTTLAEKIKQVILMLAYSIHAFIWIYTEQFEGLGEDRGYTAGSVRFTTLQRFCF